MRDFFLDHPVGCIVAVLFVLVLLVGGMALFENWSTIKAIRRIDDERRRLYNQPHEDKPPEKPHPSPADVRSSFDSADSASSSSAAATGADKPANRRRRK
jgi:hypothetical protein